jgi:hypothetical protein
MVSADASFHATRRFSLYQKVILSFFVNSLLLVSSNIAALRNLNWSRLCSASEIVVLSIESIVMSAAAKGGIFADLSYLTEGLELRAGAGEGVGVRVLDADDRL